MKIIFFGDSISDAGRDRFDESDLGAGYVKIAAGKLRLLYPDNEFVVLNRGVGGDRTEQLLARVQTDVIDEKPDVVILQVGINDAWHRFLIGVEVTAEDFKALREPRCDHQRKRCGTHPFAALRIKHGGHVAGAALLKQI